MFFLCAFVGGLIRVKMPSSAPLHPHTPQGPHGPVGPHGAHGSRNGPIGPEMGPKWAQNECMLGDGPQDGSKMDPSCGQDGLKIGPRWVQYWPQNEPKTGPKWAQIWDNKNWLIMGPLYGLMYGPTHGSQMGPNWGATGTPNGPHFWGLELHPHELGACIGLFSFLDECVLFPLCASLSSMPVVVGESVLCEILRVT